MSTPPVEAVEETLRSRTAALAVISCSVLLYFCAAIVLFPLFALISIIKLLSRLLMALIARTLASTGKDN